jgi:predicted outer membrane repeat protein
VSCRQLRTAADSAAGARTAAPAAGGWLLPAEAAPRRRRRCYFDGNTAGNMGGALLLTNVEAHTLLALTEFSNNQAKLGGAIGKTGASIEQRLHVYSANVSRAAQRMSPRARCAAQPACGHAQAAAPAGPRACGSARPISPAAQPLPLPLRRSTTTAPSTAAACTWTASRAPSS